MFDVSLDRHDGNCKQARGTILVVVVVIQTSRGRPHCTSLWVQTLQGSQNAPSVSGNLKIRIVKSFPVSSFNDDSAARNKSLWTPVCQKVHSGE